MGLDLPEVAELEEQQLQTPASASAHPQVPLPSTSTEHGQEPETEAARPVKKKTVKFVQGWLHNDKFKTWLVFDNFTGLMSCSLCKKHHKGGVWVTGTDDFRLKTLQQHMLSQAQLTAAAGEDPAQRTVQKIRDNMSSEERASYTAALKTVYWLATEEVANRKYPSLLELARQLGVKEIINLRRGGNATKESPQVFTELLTALSEVYVTGCYLTAYPFMMYTSIIINVLYS